MKKTLIFLLTLAFSPAFADSDVLLDLTVSGRFEPRSYSIQIKESGAVILEEAGRQTQLATLTATEQKAVQADIVKARGEKLGAASAMACPRVPDYHTRYVADEGRLLLKDADVPCGMIQTREGEGSRRLVELLNRYIPRD